LVIIHQLAHNIGQKLLRNTLFKDWQSSQFIKGSIHHNNLENVPELFKD